MGDVEGLEAVAVYDECIAELNRNAARIVDLIVAEARRERECATQRLMQLQSVGPGTARARHLVVRVPQCIGRPGDPRRHPVLPEPRGLELVVVVADDAPVPRALI